MDKRTPSPQSDSPFAKAVKATPDVATGYKQGLAALDDEHKSKIKVPETTKIHGSLNIDALTKKLYPESNRWDYALCYDGEVFYLEVHPASTSAVSTILEKLRWLKAWLSGSAPEIQKLTSANKHPYYWIQSSGCSIPKHMPQYKKLVQHKILPMPVWDYNKICRSK